MVATLASPTQVVTQRCDTNLSETSSVSYIVGWGGVGWGFSRARKPEPENRSQKTGAGRLLQGRRVAGEAVFNIIKPAQTIIGGMKVGWSPVIGQPVFLLNVIVFQDVLF